MISVFDRVVKMEKWEKEKMLITTVSSFSRNVFKGLLSQGHLKSQLCGEVLTLSQTSPGFYVSAVQVLKTLWEKQKLLVMSNFSFSQCFLPVKGAVCHFQ